MDTPKAPSGDHVKECTKSIQTETTGRIKLVVKTGIIAEKSAWKRCVQTFYKLGLIFDFYILCNLFPKT